MSYRNHGTRLGAWGSKGNVKRIYYGEVNRILIFTIKSRSYMVVVSADRVALVQVKSDRQSRVLDVSFIWSCPADCIDQLYSDPRGDLIIAVNSPIISSSINPNVTWSNMRSPVILDREAHDYLLLQTLLEQVVGQGKARGQPLRPRGGLINTDVFKRYASGIRSFIMSPTKHTFQLKGCVLYEYTARSNTQSSSSSAAATGAVSNAGSQAAGIASGSSAGAQEANSAVDVGYQTLINEHTAKTINRIFGEHRDSNKTNIGVGSNNTSDDQDDTLVPEGYLSFVYPLVDVVVTGPFAEDGGKQFSISINRKDSQRMRVLRREDPNSPLSEFYKTTLTLIFSTRDRAAIWVNYLEQHTVHEPKDLVDSAPIVNAMAEGGSMLRSAIRSAAGRGPRAGNLVDDDLLSNSILGLLVVPSSAADDKATTETLKIEIAKTRANVRE